MPSWTLPLVGPGLAIDLSRPRDLSLRIEPVATWTGTSPAPAASAASSSEPSEARAFGLPGATVRAVEVGPFVGDVRRGGSCNCETYAITPHGDGTHTEGVGHLLEERVPVIDLVDDALLPALVVSVKPARLEEVQDEVAGNHAPDDRVVDELSLGEAIAASMAKAPAWFAPHALVVRTAPGEERRGARHSGTNPAYFTVDAAELVRMRGFTHVLVDVPSLDREDDGGLLGAHRAFFDLPPRTTKLAPGAAPVRSSVTELIAVDSDVADGPWALALQLAPIAADAVPSRPLLFPLVAQSPSWLRS